MRFRRGMFAVVATLGGLCVLNGIAALRSGAIDDQGIGEQDGCHGMCSGQMRARAFARASSKAGTRSGLKAATGAICSSR